MSHSQKFVKKLSAEHVMSEAIPWYVAMAADDQDSVRLLTVDSTIAFAEVLSNADSKVHLLTTLRSQCADKSWRVRYVIAEKFVKVWIFSRLLTILAS